MAKSGYPEELTGFEDYVTEHAHNMLVWDIMRGNLLKLVEGKLIARGYHGSRLMTQAELQSAYGEVPVFGVLEYPEVTR